MLRKNCTMVSNIKSFMVVGLSRTLSFVKFSCPSSVTFFFTAFSSLIPFPTQQDSKHSWKSSSYTNSCLGSNSCRLPCAILSTNVVFQQKPFHTYTNTTLFNVTAGDCCKCVYSIHIHNNALDLSNHFLTRLPHDFMYSIIDFLITSGSGYHCQAWQISEFHITGEKDACI